MDLREFCLQNGIDPTKLGDIGEVSDGYHTFNSLYRQRLILFAALVNTFSNQAWKSRRHSDGEHPFGDGWFIVGIDTPKGPYTYHYEDKDWDLFHCKEVDTAPEWDGHTDKDVERVLSLAPDLDNTSDWASNEVELAIEAESRLPSDADGLRCGAGCYHAALTAYRTLTNTSHGKTSIGITKGILSRLIDGKVLTPIEDAPDIWEDITEMMTQQDGNRHFQCKRMGSFFKEVHPDGSVIYKDMNRVIAVDVDKPDVAYQNGFVTELINAIFPISMPYFPQTRKFKVFRDEFGTDPKSNDWDTVAYLYILTPDGKRIELNRYFKDEGGKLVQIEKDEFDERRAKRVVKK